MTKGIEIKPAHFPGRAPIDAYGNHGFRFADMSHRGSILCLPSGVHEWAKGGGGPLSRGDFAAVFREADTIEILLIGTGTELRVLPDPLRTAFRQAGISADSMGTGAAVRSYNVLLAEGRRVAAALVAVE